MFHGKCFKCNKCGTDLKNKAFYYTADSQLWCEPDYVANTYVKCASCEKNIVDEVVEYGNVFGAVTVKNQPKNKRDHH